MKTGTAREPILSRAYENTFRTNGEVVAKIEDNVFVMAGRVSWEKMEEVYMQESMMKEAGLARRMGELEAMEYESGNNTSTTITRAALRFLEENYDCPEEEVPTVYRIADLASSKVKSVMSHSRNSSRRKLFKAQHKMLDEAISDWIAEREHEAGRRLAERRPGRLAALLRK